MTQTPKPVEFKLFQIGDQPFGNLVIPKITAVALIFAWQHKVLDICRPGEHDYRQVHLDGTPADFNNRFQPGWYEETHTRVQERLLRIVGKCNRLTLREDKGEKWLYGIGNIDYPLHWEWPMEEWNWQLYGDFKVTQNLADGRRVVGMITPTEIVVDYWLMAKRAAKKYRQERNRDR
jgi:hypothetical protein